MNRKAQELKTLLLRIVNTQKQDLTGLVSNPDIDFSRNRKIPYEKNDLVITNNGRDNFNKRIVKAVRM